ncbi:MAG: TrpB-like pyridoxal-phosphate dependent enzyme [Spirochaetes bacterium GWF1_49_6]|nr:MAG: TrpB-like pyridoxal-phosphate dependent enzyme [Spirochaetes bacterium GWF1_49_6]
MEIQKIDLAQKDMPRKWYNIQADLPKPLDPPLAPDGKPVTPEQLGAIFPMSLIAQEVSTERWIDIPEPVLDVYARWRPAPLFRAIHLEKALGTPAKIYYKYEGASPAGSHKPNTSVAQAYYNAQAGIKRITTETGAGQWGSALALAGALFGIEVRVYMVRVSYDSKPYRKMLMNTWGAECIPSPSNMTEYGKKVLAADPNSPGSLGMAISEAVEEAATRKDTNYSLGSVLNHVLMHQTIIGLECKEQLKSINVYPDVVIGCVGGGSNFAGIAFPYVHDKITENKKVDIVAVEPRSCPTITKGVYEYDFGDTAGMAPIVKMYTLGHTFMPPAIHAGGLRYHGMAPLVSALVDQKFIEARSYHQTEVFEAGVMFARTEGIVPAPETCHAVRAAIHEAQKAKEEGKEKTILFNFSGHGFFDLSSYDKYLTGHLEDYEYPESAIKEALQHLPFKK